VALDGPANKRSSGFVEANGNGSSCHEAQRSVASKYLSTSGRAATFFRLVTAAATGALQRAGAAAVAGCCSSGVSSYRL